MLSVVFAPFLGAIAMVFAGGIVGELVEVVVGRLAAEVERGIRGVCVSRKLRGAPGCAEWYRACSELRADVGKVEGGHFKLSLS